MEPTIAFYNYFLYRFQLIILGMEKISSRGGDAGTWYASNLVSNKLLLL